MLVIQKALVPVRIHQSKKDNILTTKKYKRANNNLQNITHKTKDGVTRTQQKLGVNSGAPEGRVALVTNPVISHE